MFLLPHLHFNVYFRAVLHLHVHVKDSQLLSAEASPQIRIGYPDGSDLFQRYVQHIAEKLLPDIFIGEQLPECIIVFLISAMFPPVFCRRAPS